MEGEDREQNGEVLHVLDLPQLYTKPSAQELLNTLTLLTSEPPSWEGSDTEDDDETPPIVKAMRRHSVSVAKARSVQINPEGLTSYLTRIIASELRWIEDDAVKEEIWEAASIRLSERSGRSAMPAMTRTFHIPPSKGEVSEELRIHEPSLTADNLGLKTWASSYLLAKRLHLLADNHASLPPKADGKRRSVLELGSGTGLVGLAASMVMRTEVILTDLPEIVENLDRNALTNQQILEEHNGAAYTAILDWTTPSTMMLSSGAITNADYQDGTKFDVILAADPLYSPEHPALLVQTMKYWLARHDDARIIVELPLRSAYRPVVEDFFSRMQKIGLKICNEGYETGVDDWGSQGDRTTVRCWWTVWGWNTPQASEAHTVEHDEVAVKAGNMDDSHKELLAEFARLE